MAQLVRDVMSSSPVTFAADTPVQQAAKAMRDRDIGDVLVVDGVRLRGIVTDRDIVVRGLAEQDDLSRCTLGEVCSEHLVAAEPDEEVATALARMRENAVRRVPVVRDGHPIGVLSLGDAAVERDPNSVLANISAAPGNA
jgi:CBS domain-containing protein